MPSVLVWADIPVTDMDRAMKFYSAVLQTELLQPFPGQPVAVSPPDMSPVAFDLVMGDDHMPSSSGGTRIYLSAMGDIHAMAKRVEERRADRHAADRHGRDGGLHLFLPRLGK